ncbi:MAG TPA: hypothetical protein GXZ43_00135 [Clostridiaceae bacterium]|nr:hypothetical protein [Clostridiaceae bacterium]
MELFKTPGSEEINAMLLEILFCKRNFEEIIQEISDFLKNPIVVIDNAYYIVCSSRVEDIVDPVWSKNIERSYCDLDFIIGFNSQPSVVIGKKSAGSFFVLCTKTPYRKIVCPLYNDNSTESIGFIVLIACQHEVDEKILQFMDKISFILSLKLNSVDTSQDSSNYTDKKILSNILSGSFINRENLDERFKIASTVLSNNFYIACINLNKKFSKFNYAIAESENKNTFQFFMQENFNNHLYIQKDDYLVLILPQENFKKDIDLLNYYLPSYGKKAGISLVVENYNDTSIGFKQAQKALCIGHVASPELNVYLYQNFSFFELLDDLDPNFVLKNYQHSILMKLQKYDEENDSELYDTLFYYLFYHKSLKRAADKIFLHRNTIHSRINKIEELFEIDLNDIYLCHALLGSFFTTTFARNKLSNLSDD